MADTFFQVALPTPIACFWLAGIIRTFFQATWARQILASLARERHITVTNTIVWWRRLTFSVFPATTVLGAVGLARQLLATVFAAISCTTFASACVRGIAGTMT